MTPQSRTILAALFLAALFVGMGCAGCTHKADPNPMPAVVSANQQTEASAKETLNLAMALRKAADRIGEAAKPFKPMVDQLVASAKRTTGLAHDGIGAAQKASKTYDKMAKRYDDSQDDWFGPRMHRLFWGIGIVGALGLITVFKFGGWWGLLHVCSLGVSWMVKMLFRKPASIGVGDGSVARTPPI